MLREPKLMTAVRRRRHPTTLALWVVFGLIVTGVPGYGSTYATWDSFFYNVRLPLKAVSKTGSVDILIYHSYPTLLHDLKIATHSDTLISSPEPPRIAEFLPTEVQTIKVKLVQANDAQKGALRDTSRLTVEFRARELPGSRSVTLMVPLTVKGERALNDAMSVPVGRMDVRVGGSGGLVYYFYLLAMLALLAWLLWRRKKMA